MRQGQGIVPPFAGDRLRADQSLAVDHNAATDAGAQDDAEHDAATRRRAVRRLRDGEAVGVVGQPHFAAERVFEIGLEWPAVEACGVGVLDQARRGRDRAGMRHAHAALPAGALFQIVHDARDCGDALLVGALRRGHAQALADRAVRAQHDAFDFGAAEVDADSHARKRARRSMLLFTPTSPYVEASHLVAATLPNWNRCSRYAGSIRNLLTEPIGAI